MGPKEESVEFTSALPLAQVGSNLNQILSGLGAEVEALQQSDNPLDVLDGGGFDVGVVASGQGFLGMNAWIVQVALFQLDEGTGIALNAMGDGAWSTAWHGRRNSVPMSSSLAKRDEIAEGLQRSDSSMRPA